jgi:hypothetical protein
MHLVTLDFIDGDENVIFLGPSLYWQCRIQGAAAFRHGRPIDACPLRPGSCVLRLRVAGWLAGRREGCQCCKWRGSERFSVVEANHRDCDGRPPRPCQGCPVPRGRSDPTREDRVGIGGSPEKLAGGVAAPGLRPGAEEDLTSASSRPVRSIQATAPRARSWAACRWRARDVVYRGPPTGEQMIDGAPENAPQTVSWPRCPGTARTTVR